MELSSITKHKAKIGQKGRNNLLFLIWKEKYLMVQKPEFLNVTLWGGWQPMTPQGVTN